MSTFAARYAGTCTDCGQNIEPGDEVAYATGNALVHAGPGCTLSGRGPHGETAIDAVLVAGPTCDRCFLELPATGVCGVCE